MGGALRYDQSCEPLLLLLLSHANASDQQLPRRNDLSPLTDPMFVGRALTTLPEPVSRIQGAGTGWRGLGMKTEVLVL
jgi:hypothetical protein